jgi:hypothetical protein
MRRKIILRLSLLIVFGFMQQSCRTDDFAVQEHNQQSSISSRIIHFEELKKKPLLISELQSFSKTKIGAENSVSRIYTDSENGSYVDVENVMYSEDPYGGKTYTFQIIRDIPKENLENLVMVEKEDGLFETYIFEYDKGIELNYYASAKELKDALTEHVTITNLGRQKGIGQNSKLMFTECGQNVIATWVETPGTLCASGLHTFENGEDCNYWGTVDMALPAYGGHYEYTFQAGNCNPASAGTGATLGTTGPYPNGGGTFPSYDDPCTKIKAKFSNVKFKEKVQAIDKPDVFDYDHEMGYAAGYPPANTGVTGTQYPPMENILGSHNVTLPNGNQYFGFMHSHNNKEGVVKIFSPGDLATFLTSCVANAEMSGIITDAYCMVITSEGNYMLNYTGNTSNFGYTSTTKDAWLEWYVTQLKKIQNDDNTFDQDKLEKLFLRFLQEKVKIDGIELYKIEKITGKANKLSLDDNNNVIPTPCPN